MYMLAGDGDKPMRSVGSPGGIGSTQATGEPVDSQAVQTQPQAQTQTQSQSDQKVPGIYADYSADALARADGKRIVFFHASWCIQCRQLESSIKAGTIPEGVTIFKVDYDANQKLRQQYGVTLQTTLVLLDENGNVAKKYVAYDQPTLDAIVKNLL